MNYLKIGAVVASLGIGLFCYNWATKANTSDTNRPETFESTDHGEYTIVSAAEVENLQVFLINGEEKLGSKRYTTLAADEVFRATGGKGRKRKGVIDKIAAAQILQSYLQRSE